MCNTPICFVKSPMFPESNVITNRSVVYKGKTWDVGSTINIGFINGTAQEISTVKQVYGELEFLNLKFNYVQDLQKSDVRWSFTKGLGSWSYIGTDAMFIDKFKPTVNIGWEIDKTVVRHELGHSLGLAHEHQNPSGGINWNKQNVIRDLTGPPNNWSIAQIEHNVFKALTRENVDFTNFDSQSVMLYAFPASWTLDNKGTSFNSTWSVIDIATLKKFYPKVEQPVEPTEPTNPVDNSSDMIKFLKDVFEDSKRLSRLTEVQLVRIGAELGISASVDDLKRETVAKLSNVIFK